MFTTRTAEGTTANLVVRGAVSKDSNCDIARIVFQNYDADEGRSFDMAAIAARDHYGSAQEDGVGDLVIRTSDGSSMVERLRVAHDGRVGVGTSAPGAALDVAGEARASNLSSRSNFEASNFVAERLAWADDSNAAVSFEGGAVIVKAGGAERLRFDAAGRLGVGTSNPQHAIDVFGDVNFTGSVLKNGAPFVASAGENEWASNAAAWASNAAAGDVARAQWASETLDWSSNSSNASAEAAARASWASNAAAHASGAASWASNAAQHALAASNSAAAASNSSAWTRVAGDWASNSISGASNSISEASNSAEYAASAASESSNAASGASNAAAWASASASNADALATSALSRAGWASNSAMDASNAAAWRSGEASSNAAAWADAAAAWASNATEASLASNAAASNSVAAAAAEFEWASNVALWALSEASNSSNAIAAASNDAAFASNYSILASNLSGWASNAAGRAQASASAASNYAAWASNSDAWSSNSARSAQSNAPANSNTAFALSNAEDAATAASASNASATAYASAVWTSNTAVYASNISQGYSNSATVSSNTAIYASNSAAWASNEGAPVASSDGEWASNSVANASNASAWTSNASAWASSVTIYSNSAIYASNVGFNASNTAYYSSNALHWVSNSALYGSNLATTQSNAARFATDAAPSQANMASKASNAAAWALSAAISASNAAHSASAKAPWASNALAWALASNPASSAAFSSNASASASNFVAYASNAAGSETAYWASNAAATASNGAGDMMADWSSNSAAYASNSASPSSNAALQASNSAAWASNSAGFSAASAAFASNAVALASNASHWASNATQFSSNASASASNASVWTSNAIAPSSNAAYWASNNIAAQSGVDASDSATLSYSNVSVLLNPASFASNSAKWAATVDGSGDDRTTSIAMDASGNVYVCGYCGSAVATVYNAGNSNSGLSISESGGAAFVIKYDSNGTAIWSITIDGTNDEKAYSIACDSNGYLYVVGTYGPTAANAYNATYVFSGPSMLPPMEIPATSGGEAAFLVKYDSGGSGIWVATVEGASAAANAVCVDSIGDVYIAGNYSNAAVIYNAGGASSGLTLPATNSNAAFAVKYDSSGSAQWRVRFDAAAEDYAYAVAVDNAKSLYVAISYSSSESVSVYGAADSNSGVTLAETDGYGGALVKFDSNGIAQWSAIVDGSPPNNVVADTVYSIAADQYGYVYFAGSSGYIAGGSGFTNTNIIGPGGYPNFISMSNENAGYAVKISSNGTLQWVARIGSRNIGSPTVRSIRVDTSCNLYLAGHYNISTFIYYPSYPATGPVAASNPDGFTLRSPSNIASYVVKYDGNGNPGWYFSIDGNNDDYGLGLAVDSASNVYICGHYSSNATVYNWSNVASELSLPAASGSNSGYLVKFEGEYYYKTYKLLSGAGAERNGLIKTIVNASSSADATLLVRDSNDTITLRALTIASNSCERLAWYNRWYYQH